ncbi:GNAT family N-acetyltransferase [Chitinophaga sp. 22321]|uniref:GNAT family N-acetyltransferase n=1 Tax=Chitinophaga hostae TaxID=2831022 RepID=A0ABS5J434_9BACT|nr:GNAT family N-acetyltransferase [Chitinophaga hostae]MBS0029988.1 GNAT family N-acetyltransferase [Chitinophaga hostae]
MKEIMLDNPAWGALTSEQASFAIGTDHAKRYQPGIVPFIACDDPQADHLAALDAWILPGETFYIIGDLPALPQGWVLEHELPCAQMVLRSSMPPMMDEEGITVSLLGEADATEMYDLINSLQPGYYNRDTRLLGTYYGIRLEGKLVAMAGERMRLTGFTELSAICTHKDYAGRGYAQRLINRLCRQQADAGIISYLHVSLANERAIRIYDHMGFEQRRTISFRRVRKQ